VLILSSEACFVGLKKGNDDEKNHSGFSDRAFRCEFRCR